MPKSTNPLVVIAAYDSLCTFEFGCAFEVFGLSRPEMGPGWYRCKTSAVEAGPIRGAGGLVVNADGGLELFEQAHTIVIPGWRVPDVRIPKPFLEALQDAHAKGTRLVSICGGAFVLAQAGLLAGRRATTHWHHAGTLATTYPDISVEQHSLYVDEGDIMTSAGSAAGLDLCIHVVRKDFGAKAANSVARRLVVAPHRDGGQKQFIERPVAPRETTRLSALLDGIRGNLSQQWTVQRMAQEACMSVRSLHRHIREATGAAPGEWLQHERLARARELLEETSLPISIIAADIGLGTATNFRNHFRSAVGVSPAAYRSKFRAAGIGQQSRPVGAQVQR